MATYVVGDIQGCFEPLQRLLANVAFSPSRDQLWSVGDMVNRGPQSLETLLFLEQLGAAFTGVLGNHDLHFLALASKVNALGKAKSLRPLLDSPACSRLFEWVRQLPLAHRQRVQTDQGPRQVLMVHAGIAPDWSFSSAVEFAAEVSAALRESSYVELLRGMYGDEPHRWDPALQGIERLRVITNVLTRLRFCTTTGDMNMTDKGEADTAPPGYRPWFDYHYPAGDELLLFGHWATLEGLTNRSNILGLDTGCVWGRCMTLLHLEKLERVTVSCQEMN
jgi:bis(5'-nucleosyl)-tetraphosphatase (symmetrical)